MPDQQVSSYAMPSSAADRIYPLIASFEIGDRHLHDAMRGDRVRLPDERPFAGHPVHRYRLEGSTMGAERPVKGEKDVFERGHVPVGDERGVEVRALDEAEAADVVGWSIDALMGDGIRTGAR